MTLEQNTRKQSEVIPKRTKWIKESVGEILAEKNTVILSNNEQVTYDYLIVALGIQLRYDLIEGCPEALDSDGVCSNYSPRYAEKTFQEVKKFKGGNAIFTFPNTPIKCAGAPQKACYISDSLMRQQGVRPNANLIYTTSLAKLFGIESYLNALNKVAEEKNIDVRTRTNLIKVDPGRKVATFEKLDDCAKPTGETYELEYSLLHISPPCSAPEPLRRSDLADSNGYLDVDPETLQSKKYSNVFGAGDCMNTSNAKTAAAVSSHLKTLEKNLMNVMDGKKMEAKYDGYASCPLVVSLDKAILAEFNSQGTMETTPFRQDKPKRSAYLMKRYLFPFLYWNALVKGYWNGPSTIRRILHFGARNMSK